ncbi:MAG: YeeE/YedE family protein [Gammaproteobacteria bacterium]|nr:YeeE/YedE family protein [Gammaproteobacteria bacterium]NNL99551.1 YeeE/YedE family protein [Gammaproteobacteria bacterium]
MIFSPYSLPVLGLAAALGALMGAVIAHTRYCTLGAVADWVSFGDGRRFRMWLLAAGTALAGCAVLEAAGWLDPADTRMPYASALFAWPRYLAGGLIFGVGVVLSGGCASRILVRTGLGSGKALVTLAAATIAAWLMTETTLYGNTLHRWLSPWYVDLRLHGLDSQRLSGASKTLAPVLAGAIAAALLGAALASPRFRAAGRYLFGGVAMGLLVTGGWALTAGPLGSRWIEEALFMDAVPRGIGAQSFTFVGPLGETLEFGLSAGGLAVTFGMAAVAGVMAGSFIYGLTTGQLRWEGYRGGGELLRNIAGGALLGVGGVLALGCTVGQGLTGISTLSAGSLLATLSTLAAMALTIRTEYYRLVSDGTASWPACLGSALADFRLLPGAWRSLVKPD